MAVIREHTTITRSQVQANPDKLFLFGDNSLRKGLGGQAKEMRGEKNVCGIVTKKYPNMGDNAFLTDTEYSANIVNIMRDVISAFWMYVNNEYIGLVIPQMGVGLAQLPTRAPKTYAFLIEQLQWLEDTINSLP